MKPLIIIGAGGHGKVVRDIARLCGYTQVFFLDDADIPGIAGAVSDYQNYLDVADFFVAIGNNGIREKISQNILADGGELVTLIHPNAVIAENVTIGKGTVVMAGAVVNTDAVIGDGVILNTCSSTDHDCIIQDFSHIAVGAHLCGTVKVGSKTMIGAGATVINNVDICDECTVGAGAVVVKTIEEKGIYVGVPARKHS